MIQVLILNMKRIIQSNKQQKKLKQKQKIQDEIDEKLYQDFYGKPMETQEDIMKFFEEKPDSKFNDDEWNPDKFLFG